MGKDTRAGLDRRQILRRAAIAVAFVTPVVLAGCGVGGGEIDPKCKNNPQLCFPDFPDF